METLKKNAKLIELAGFKVFFLHFWYLNVLFTLLGKGLCCLYSQHLFIHAG